MHALKFLALHQQYQTCKACHQPVVAATELLKNAENAQHVECGTLDCYWAHVEKVGREGGSGKLSFVCCIYFMCNVRTSF